MKRRLAAVAVLALGVIFLLPSATTAGPFESISGQNITIVVEKSGDLLITEEIAYDFGSTFHHGIFRNVPVRFDYPKKKNFDRIYPLDVLSVDVTGDASNHYELFDLEENGIGYKQIRIGDADREDVTGEHTYTIKYRVKGALNAFEDHVELYWNAVGVEWGVTTATAEATVIAPTNITKAACYTGPFESRLACEAFDFDGDTASFLQTDLFPYNALTVVVAIPKGAVPAAATKPILDERWTVGKAFDLNGTTGALAGGILVVGLGGYALAFSRFGRDRRFKGGAVDQAFGSESAEGSGGDEVTPLFPGHTETPVEFVPPDDLGPGQVGTLVDFKANPLDVTATIVDLAVRKYIRIDEVETESKWLKNDWKIVKLKEPDAKLKKYEEQLLDGLFQGRDDEVQLSELKYKFANRMQKVQKALDEDAKKQGWFVKDPNSACFSVGCLGFLVMDAGIALTALLAAFTSYGLVGIPVILLGVAIMASGAWAPARSAKGSALLRRVDGFRRFIEESEQPRAEFAEKKNIFSEYLPYAIVFGAVDKWARTFKALSGEEPDTAYWYHSTTPFEYAAFSSSINGFTTTTAGTLTSSPPSTSGSSGFSGGGGSSGGGGGGGGGGSW